MVANSRKTIKKGLNPVESSGQTVRAVQGVVFSNNKQHELIIKHIMVQREGVETAIHYPIPIHLQPASAFLGYRKGDFPITEAQTERILTLPIHQYLQEGTIQEIAEHINSFFEKHADRD